MTFVMWQTLDSFQVIPYNMGIVQLVNWRLNMEIKFSLPVRGKTEHFGLSFGLSYNHRVYAFVWHNTTWGNGNFICRPCWDIIKCW